MRVLLVQTSFLGDTILSTPVIQGIVDLYPGAELWMMTTPQSAELVKYDPRLKGVIPFDKRGEFRGPLGLLRMADDLRSRRFDIAYSLHRSLRTTLLLRLARIPLRVGFANARLSFLYHRVKTRPHTGHEVERNIALLEGERRGFRPKTDLALFPPEERNVSPLVRDLGTRTPFVTIFPGSEWKTKRWKWEGYRDVSRFLRSEKREVFLLGSKKERPIAEQIAAEVDARNLAGHLTLGETLYLVSRSSLVVCNDSMALHVASSFQVPAVAVFCATSPEFGFGPWKNHALVVQKEGLSCKPCRRHGSQVCPNGSERCMQDLESLEVINAVRSVL